MNANDTGRREGPPLAMPPDATHRLCPACAQIDFAAHITDAEKGRTPARYELAAYPDIVANAMAGRCAFCRLAWAGGAGEESGGWGRGVFAEWVPERGFVIAQMHRTIVVKVAGHAPGHPHGVARRIPAVFDPRMLARWVALCAAHHGEGCAPTPGVRGSARFPGGLKRLRMIDVHAECVVEIAEGEECVYVALSYMWGRAETVKLVGSNMGALMAAGGLREAPVPRTIRDAMEAVRGMGGGMRYLWVDALCLLQDDGAEMGDAVGKMHLVYRGAAATILAAHGEDANAGLPGLHANSRWIPNHIERYKNAIQYGEEVRPGVWMTVVEPLADVLMPSMHLTRGWTMQEHALSHRLLIFTPKRVYFQCARNCWSEDTVYDDFPEAENVPIGLDLRKTGVGLMGEEEERPYEKYGELVLKYCTRRLTQETDTLNAAAGFLAAMGLMMKSEMVAGLPAALFDAALLFFDAWPDEDKTGLRKDGFPSWSWAGWRSPAVFMMAQSGPGEINAWLSDKTYIVWYARESRHADARLVRAAGDGGGRETRPSALEAGAIGREHALLQFWAYTVAVHAFERPDERAYYMYERTRRVRGRDGALWGGMRLNDASLVGAGPHECVVVASADRYCNELNDGDDNIFAAINKPICWVILIARDGPLAERRGLGFLYEEYARDREWKEIVLA